MDGDTDPYQSTVASSDRGSSCLGFPFICRNIKWILLLLVIWLSIPIVTSFVGKYKQISTSVGQGAAIVACAIEIGVAGYLTYCLFYIGCAVGARLNAAKTARTVNNVRLAEMLADNKRTEAERKSMKERIEEIKSKSEMNFSDMLTEGALDNADFRKAVDERLLNGKDNVGDVLRGLQEEPNFKDKFTVEGRQRIAERFPPAG